MPAQIDVPPNFWITYLIYLSTLFNDLLNTVLMIWAYVIEQICK